ncbi:MAG: hypothetical protein OXM61_02865 [Candidatus Poribacteria bacterium]|nr:hypothetical protein [Candidatus Poribacteria bacterium]
MNAEDYGTAVTRILTRGSEAKKKISGIKPDASVTELHSEVLNQLDERIRNAIDSVTLDFLLEDDSAEDTDSN